MIVERFSQNIIGSGILKLYMAIGFFASLIFFVLNLTIFTPMEIMIGMVAIIIGLKGTSNIMLGIIISLFNFDNKENELHHQVYNDKINSLMSELNLKEQEIKLNKH